MASSSKFCYSLPDDQFLADRWFVSSRASGMLLDTAESHGRSPLAFNHATENLTFSYRDSLLTEPPRSPSISIGDR
jgi:hypothetical protein